MEKKKTKSKMKIINIKKYQIKKVEEAREKAIQQILEEAQQLNW